LTVTEQVAVLSLSSVFTVMVALPVDTALTTPFADTVATEILLLLHVIALLVASAGWTVAVNVSEAPTSRESVFLFRDTPVTGIVVLPLVTVTAQVAVLLPSCVVTVIVALPADTAVTTPFVTVATEEALLLHVTLLFVAFAGKTVTVNVSEAPTVRLSVVLFKVTPVTGTEVVLIISVPPTNPVAEFQPFAASTLKVIA
jgi:hypothetical protein